ncbi:MAG: hypothetical protein CVV49_18815 [Spirochaetae bacterium HGW-Spirochaetae-5]|nr:MAG: hypothetical protein CVV49_18815 [Spirochaetae bacterium HGW-Spirochaetae-5]
MKKSITAVILVLLLFVITLPSCNDIDDGSTVSIPENSNVFSIPSEDGTVGDLVIIDSDGNSVNVETSLNTETGLIDINLPALTQGDSFTIQKSGQADTYVAVTSADNTSPQLISGNIANGAQDVEVNLPVDLSFSKVMDGSSINGTTVVLKEIKYNRTVPVRFIYNYDRIIVIPRMKLQQNLEYKLAVNGIKDITGQLLSFEVNYKNRDLDYGLYFFGKYGECEKYFPGIQNAFYNDSKPTMIYAHGWQANAVTKSDYYGRSFYGYEQFFWEEDDFKGQTKYNGLRQFTNHSWIDKGWNTGFVYWQQFADEPALAQGNVGGVHDAEAKIWSFQGYKGSRYRVVDSSGSAYYKNWDCRLNFNGDVVTVDSVGRLLSLYVNNALKNNVSGNIRFVGHSLGNQVVNNLMKYAFDAGITVNRIALLDPAWTSGDKNYLPNDGYGKWVGERCRNFIFESKNRNSNLAVEIYHTTGMNIGIAGLAVDTNDALTNAAADFNAAPWYYSSTQLDGKHNSIRNSYIWSFEFQPPAEVTISWWKRSATGKMGPSASTPDWRMREMMGPKYEWTQVEGRYTPSPSDDQWERKSKDTSWFSLW